MYIHSNKLNSNIRYKFDKQHKNKPQKKDFPCEEKSFSLDACKALKSQVLFNSNNKNYAIKSNSIKKPLQKPYFAAHTDDNTKKIIESCDISLNKKNAATMALLLKNPDGTNFFKPEIIEKLISPDFSEEQIDNILKRNLINEDLSSHCEPFLFSLADDNSWEKIKPVAHKMYAYALNENNAMANELLVLLNEYIVNKTVDFNYLIETYSKAKILNTVKNERNADILYNAISKGNTQSSNIEMLLDFVLENELNPQILTFESNTPVISKNVQNDLDKLYLAYAENKNPKDIFIPEFKTKEQASLNTKTGEVCKIENNSSIHVKNRAKKLEELFITPKAYLQLFPAAESNIFTQNKTGDCFLISPIAALYSNLNSRHIILKMFKQNDDNTISVCTNGYTKQNGDVVKKNKTDFEIPDIDFALKENLPLSYTSPALKSIELLFEKSAEYNSKASIIGQYNTYLDAYKKLQGENFAYINGNIITKKEMELFLKYAKQYLENPDKSECMIFSPSNKYGFQTIRFTNSLEYANKVLDLCDDKYKEYLTEVLQGLSNVCVQKNISQIDFSRCMPFEVYKAMDISKNVDPSTCYIYGGSSLDVFRKLELDSHTVELNSQKAQALLYDKDASKKFVYTATQIFKKENCAHEYYLEIRDEPEGRKFAVVNPHNSAEEKFYTLDELLASGFEYLTYAQIPAD